MSSVISTSSRDDGPGYYVAKPCDAPLLIVHVDEDIVVIDKPSGLYTIPGRGPENTDSAITRLQRDYPEAIIIHRLDLDTSGLLVVPRTFRGRSMLSRQIRERTMQKVYEAVVWGLVADDTGSIDLPLERDMANRPRVKIDYVLGKASLTHYTVIARDEARNRTHLRLTPLTGRQHQLRIHLASIGHPILGCDLYAHEDAYRATARLMLHASVLGFTHPATDEWFSRESPAPFGLMSD
ncbi:MAG: RluA family pseudouridine synthase [Actinomycetota bacterium]|nr:RluA family pseudouridine synthase [Actinomycetota bacterium]